MGILALQRGEEVNVSYDDDFVSELTEDDYAGVLYVHDESLPVAAVADIVHAISTHYPQSEVTGIEYAGEAWL